MKTIRVEVLNIGTELLKDKVNTNLVELSKYLERFNVKINRAYSVCDDINELKNVLALALDNSDIIISTGGLGPTIDDITKQSVSEVIWKKLVFSDEIFEKILLVLKKRGRKVSEDLKNNLKNMAHMIKGSLVLDNGYGTAPGLLCNIVWNKEHKTIIILPGPPDEMKSILENGVSKYFKTEKWLNFQERIKLLKNSKKIEFQIFGAAEAEIDLELRNILNSNEILQYKNKVEIKTAILINSGLIYVRFDLIETCHGKSLHCHPEYDSVNAVCEILKSKMKQKFNDKILAENNIGIAELVVKKLINDKKTISVAESCTGGLICKMITDILGSSECFVGGIVAYSNESKISKLKVSRDIIKKFGAVSEQTAIEMAEGSLKNFSTDYAISTTGIAGPTGGSKNKPVGLVYIAIASKMKETVVVKWDFNGDRTAIRERAATVALAKVMMEIKILNRKIKK